MTIPLDELNPRQQEAVRTVEGPLMVVAGPGSGKTRVLSYRIAHLIGMGVPAYSILALTFTNKAASEMKERITRLVGAKSAQLWMGTFHSLLARLLRIECEQIGFTSNFTIYDSQDSQALIKRIMNSLGIPSQQFNPQAIRSRISGAKNEFISPVEYRRLASDVFEENTASVYEEYQAGLKRNNAMDFDDLLVRPIELFSGHRKTLLKYQDRFRFILVDEYQDTNHAQYSLVKQLGERHRNVCAVGDDAQSIYAFRGADIRNILDFGRDYPEAKIIRLEQNYRSTKTILAAADQIIKKNVDQLSKDLWTANPAGELITVLECEDDRHEAAAVASSIVGECRKSKADLSQVAVMYRTNAQSRSLEDALRRNSIPYVIVGGVEFYQRKEIKDVLAYLRVLVNASDNDSLLRILNYPARGLGDVAVKRLVEFAKAAGIGLLGAAARAGEISGLSASARAAMAGVAALFRKYAGLKQEISPSELVRSMIDELGILPLLKAEGTPEAMARWENVQELLSAITEFGAGGKRSLEEFLQEVSLLSDIDQWDDSHNAVTLLTLHSAKGLEFPVVFITGLEEGLLPFYSPTSDRKEIEEERRLYYVGVTRAMRKLYLSHARVRFRFGEASSQSPSRFLEEVDPALLEIVHGGGYRVPHPAGFRNRAARDRFSRNDAADEGDRFFPDPPGPDPAAPEPGGFGAGGGDDALPLRVGGLVDHEVFGRGRVEGLSGSGDSLKAVIRFQSVGRKNLLLKYARLRII
ncbi:MAG TPA: UvrD-helicase domain-containing protein [Bacteroidota bacterium]